MQAEQSETVAEEPFEEIVEEIVEDEPVEEELTEDEVVVEIVENKLDEDGEAATAEGEPIEQTEPVEEEAVIEEMRRSYLRQRSGLLRRTLAMAIAALALTVLLVMQYQPDAVNASAEIISVYSQSLPQEE